MKLHSESRGSSGASIISQRKTGAWRIWTAVILFACVGGWRGWLRWREPSWGGRGVQEWLESEAAASSQCGLRDGFTTSWMEPTPTLMEAIRAMGQRAIPRLVEIGLSSEELATRRAILSRLEDYTPWLRSRLPHAMQGWLLQGEALPWLARSVISELHPSFHDLIPCVSTQLSNPRALVMLSDVSDEREAAAQLISAQVGANGSVAVHSLLWVGQPGAAAKSGFLRVLNEDGENGRTAFRGLCHLGPAAQDCLSELRSLYDRQAQPLVRIQLAAWVGAVDPGSFWAEAEMRVELESQDIERIAGALRILKTWPYLVPIFRTELQRITKTGVGHFDPVDVAELQRNEWRRRFTNPTIPSGGEVKSIPSMDLAAKAGALLERGGR